MFIGIVMADVIVCMCILNKSVLLASNNQLLDHNFTHNYAYKSTVDQQ